MSVKTLRWTKPLPLRQWSAVAYVWGVEPITVSTVALSFDHARAVMRMNAAQVFGRDVQAVYLENIGSVPALPEGGAN